MIKRIYRISYLANQHKQSLVKLLNYMQHDRNAKQKLVVVPFQFQHIEEASHLLTKTFLSINPLVKNLKLDQYIFLAGMKMICGMAVTEVYKYKNFPMSWSLLRDEKVVAVFLNCELTNYVNKIQEIHSGIQSFDAYHNANLQFWDSFDTSKYKEGEAVYGGFLGVDPEDTNKGYALLLTDALLSEGIDKMKYYITKISNQKMAKLFIKHRQAKIIEEFSFTLHGVTHPFWMVEINFQEIRNQSVSKDEYKLQV